MAHRAQQGSGTLKSAVLRALGGLLLGYVLLAALSIPGAMLVDRLAPDATTLSGVPLAVDFALGMVVVAVAGFVVARLLGAVAVYTVAAFLVVASIAAPAPNWPMLASTGYAVGAIAILVAMARLVPRRRRAAPDAAGHAPPLAENGVA